MSNIKEQIKVFNTVIKQETLGNANPDMRNALGEGTSEVEDLKERVHKQGQIVADLQLRKAKALSTGRQKVADAITMTSIAEEQTLRKLEEALKKAIQKQLSEGGDSMGKNRKEMKQAKSDLKDSMEHHANRFSKRLEAEYNKELQKLVDQAKEKIEEQIKPDELSVKLPDTDGEVKIERPHPKLKEVLEHVTVGNLVFLTGPAGSGKTTLGMQVADALQRKFYFTGAVHQKHELLGFTDAKGVTVRTPFREAYENGGVFLFDEFDACTPHAVTPFNAALSNKHCAFPDGIVHQHDEFVAIAAGNTYGTGANRQYVGRYQQDAASLDRFVMIQIDYDKQLEELLVSQECAKWGNKAAHRATNFLIKARCVREAVNELGIPHIVSPRASMMAARMYGAHDKVSDPALEEQLLWKGLSEDQRKQINQHMTGAG